MNRTALHLSALTGNTDIYRRLIELGLDPKSMDQKGKTAEYYLRNNPTISSAELQDLLALSNNSAAGGGGSNSQMATLQTNSRLSKMTANGKSSSQSNLATANGGIAGAPLKISSKPVRLPALSRPGAGKTGSSSVKSQSENVQKKEQAKSKESESEEVALHNGDAEKDVLTNGEQK